MSAKESKCTVPVQCRQKMSLNPYSSTKTTRMNCSEQFRMNWFLVPFFLHFWALLASIANMDGEAQTRLLSRAIFRNTTFFTTKSPIAVFSLLMPLKTCH